MTQMLAVRLRSRVCFEQAETVRDSNGYLTQVWTPVRGAQNVPAEILTGPGKEAIAAGQPVSTIAARITVRMQAALASPYGMRAVAAGEIYHVETYYLDQTGLRWMTLVCSRGTKNV